MVEIAKALVRNPRLVIMDEATSALTRETWNSSTELSADCATGCGSAVHLPPYAEISAIADICSVFRNGKHIDTFSMASRTTEEIVPMMIGRELAELILQRSVPGRFGSSDKLCGP